MKPYYLYIFLFLFLFLFSSCPMNAPDSPSQGGGSITFNGYIRSAENNFVVPDARIRIKDTEVVSDSTGYFSVTVANVTDDDSVRISREGFVIFQKSLRDFSRKILTVEMILKPTDVTIEIDPANPGGNKVTAPDGASVFIPELTGISEPLLVSLTRFDANTEKIKSASGDFTTINSSHIETACLSRGILDVSVKGKDSGDSYNLEGMGSFEITIPVAVDTGTLPETIPLEYFDTVSCKWIEEGSASRSADDPNCYKGTVTHFSSWNLGNPVQGVNVYGLLNDPVPANESYEIDLETDGYGRTIYTNAKSFYVTGIPQGMNMKASVTKQSTKQTWTRFFYSYNATDCINIGTIPDEDEKMPPPNGNHFPLHIINPGYGIYAGLYITQCVENGKQRVWQVGNNLHWAEFMYIEDQHDACGPSGGLRFRDANVDAGTWITWCTGSAQIPKQQLAWKADGSSFAPFLYSQEGSECYSIVPPSCPPADNAPLSLSGNMGGIFPGLVITNCIDGGMQRKWIVSENTSLACFAGIVPQEGYCGPPYGGDGHIPHLWIHTDPGNRVAAGTWIIWCSGYSTGEQYVWNTDSSGFVARFLYSQYDGSCASYQTPPPATPEPTQEPTIAPTQPPGDAEPCARCILDSRPDILVKYQAEGWDISPANWYNIIDNWSKIDPAGYAVEKVLCGTTCETSPAINPRIKGLAFIAFDDQAWFDPAQKSSIPAVLSDMGANSLTFSGNFDMYMDNPADRTKMTDAARFLIQNTDVELIGCFVGIPVKYRKADRKTDAGSYDGNSAMINDIKSFLTEFYALGIKKWHVWFEADAWASSEIRNASAYAQVYNAFYTAAKSVSQELKVAPNCGFSSTAWLDSAIGQINGYDAISYHPYPNANDPTDIAAKRPPYLNIRGIESLEKYGVKLWLTAYGMIWSTGTETGDNEQALRLKAALAWLNYRPSVEHAFYFRFNDVVHNDGYIETFGLLKNNIITADPSVRKPAYYIFQNPFK